MGVGTVATIEEILLPFAKEIASIDFESQGFNVTFRHWQEALGPAKTQDLEAALGRFSNRITRADLFELARECAKRPNDLPLHRQAFLGVMLWGYGHTPRWGPERVARILAELAAVVAALELHGPAVTKALRRLDRATTAAWNAVTPVDPTKDEWRLVERAVGIERGWNAAYQLVSTLDPPGQGRSPT
jgi:hypothetical protein